MRLFNALRQRVDPNCVRGVSRERGISHGKRRISRPPLYIELFPRIYIGPRGVGEARPKLLITARIMLFYSYEFLFIFLPAVFAGFFCVAFLSQRIAVFWLTSSSLVFYAYWNYSFLPLILCSVIFNYIAGLATARLKRRRWKNVLLAGAVSVDLAALGYFKYTNFFLATINSAFDQHWGLSDIGLPLGISIFTFTQIAFLIDVSREVTREDSLLNYSVFVSYFPHLIAGPIIHHRQIMPQFAVSSTYRIQDENILCGLLIFCIGLAKKVLLAASFSEYADAVFGGVRDGAQPGLVIAWSGALAYTLQIYFDFSGYSDMAIGLSRLFNIVLPENFNSPYKAASVIEFWRRWNITLSTFLRDYLYIPLGGSRRGPLRRYLNLFITMLLGGLWHGASWTFAVWGSLHGLFLAVNHAWESRKRPGPMNRAPELICRRSIARFTTFLVVTVAWVFFRADSFATAFRMLAGMFGGCTSRWGGSSAAACLSTFNYWLPPDSTIYRAGLMAVGLLLIWCAPNTRQIMERIHICDVRWRFAAVGASAFWIFMLAAISASRDITAFVYFNF